jgi:hypothetical protein
VIRISIWNPPIIILNPLNTKLLKRNRNLGFRKRRESYSIAFLFAASIIVLAIYSSIPNLPETDAASE